MVWLMKENSWEIQTILRYFKAALKKVEVELMGTLVRRQILELLPNPC